MMRLSESGDDIRYQRLCGSEVTGQMRHYWQRTARRLGWDRNPLRRRIDRAETAIMTVLLAALVIASPLLAVVAGRAADAAALREQRAERGWYQAPAVLLQNAGQAVITASGTDLALVRARWTERGGKRQTGLVPTALNARIGQRLEIWLTSTGHQTSPPLAGIDVWDRVTFAAGLAATGWCAVIGLAAVAVRLVADRRRMASWEHEWAAAGPRWSHRG